MAFFEFIQANALVMGKLIVEHIGMTALSVLFAILVGIPLGILASYFVPSKKPIMFFANIIQAIPSIALLGIMIPIFGTGKVPSVFAVTLYSLLPIIKNTNTGLSNISPQTNEVAKGIGLKSYQRLFRVQIPLALPFIMSGIRISAVTAVGLVTMAAYIGAGGLGRLVMEGISSINITSIFAGAIPACILALLVDFTFGIIEKLIVPKGIAIQNNKLNFFEKFLVSINNAIKLRKLKKYKNRGIAIDKNNEEIITGEKVNENVVNIENKSKSKKIRTIKDRTRSPFSFTKFRRISQIVTVCIIFISVITLMILPTALEPEYDFSIGSKTATEQSVLNHVFAEYIEGNTNYKVERKVSLGDTLSYYAAFEKDNFDISVGYSGTMFATLLKQSVPTDITPDKRLDYITNKVTELMEDQYKVKGFNYLPFNNTYTLAVKKSFADKYNLKTISDLATLSTGRDVIFGVTVQFQQRESDGLEPLKTTYGIYAPEKNVKELDGALRYSDLMKGGCDVIDAYSTDGLLEEYGLVVLEDDKHFFPDYNVIPFIKKATLEKYKDLDCIKKLIPYLTDANIRAMNKEVDVNHRPPKVVAKQWLKSKGLI